jgi:hypothetical protein
MKRLVEGVDHLAVVLELEVSIVRARVRNAREHLAGCGAKRHCRARPN